MCDDMQSKVLRYLSNHCATYASTWIIATQTEHDSHATTCGTDSVRGNASSNLGTRVTSHLAKIALDFKTM
eukprot:3883462-Amphidinium_carterae.1